MPEDFLPNCTVLLSCFLPFANEIGDSNIESDAPSAIWFKAYNETNQMFMELGEHISHVILNGGISLLFPHQ